MGENELAAIEARRARAATVRPPVTGEMAWLAEDARAVYLSSRDVTRLVAEVRRLRRRLPLVVVEYAPMGRD